MTNADKAPSVKRDVQLSMVEGMERPVGKIVPSVITGPNAELIRSVAPLYLNGSVLDVTYGGGKWWELYRPDPFTFHDLALDGVDFRTLPHADREFDTVAYDPPYTESGGESTGSVAAANFQSRYGIGVRNIAYQRGRVDNLILDGLTEVCRVASQFVLVKCMEYAQGPSNGNGKDFHDVPTMVTNAAAAVGWTKHDQIVHYTGTGPGGHNIFTVKRARRAHSYLLVFTR